MTTRQRFLYHLRFWLLVIGAFYIGGIVAWNYELSKRQSGGVGSGILLLEAGSGIFWLFGAALASFVSGFVALHFPNLRFRIPLLAAVIAGLLLGLTLGALTFNPTQAEFL